MKFIKTYPSASATRPGAAVGTATRKYAIMLAMGLTASIASAVLAAVETPIGREGRVSNSFVTVEGEGVGVLDDGSISYDEGATGDIIVTARPGWRVNGQKSVTLNPARGSRQPLGATSDLHEDQEHIHFFPRSESEEHVPDSHMEIFAEANPASAITMYALPDTSTVVTVSANVYLMRSALHRKVAKYGKCWCGQARDPEIEYGLPYAVKPDRYEWTASGPGASFADSTWTGEMSKGLAQKIEFTVKAKRSSCTECDCEAKAEATVDVHELSIERPDYIGLDMTDENRDVYSTGSGKANVEPAPYKVEYEWLSAGRCKLIESNADGTVLYGANAETGPSGSYLEEELVVNAQVWNSAGKFAESCCTTNFTVVAVDVEINGVGEDKEETTGAFVQYVADTNGLITVEGTNRMVSVAFSCKPSLPAEEMVKISFSGNGELYEKLPSGELVKITKEAAYPACEVGKHKFLLHGHEVSSSLRDGKITIEHISSGAVDIAKYTDVKFDIKATCDSLPGSGKFGKNPEVFKGPCLDFGTPDAVPPRWWLPGTKENPSSQALNVFFKYIKDESDEPGDFTVKFDADLRPAALLSICKLEWTQTDGPATVPLTNIDKGHAELQNPPATGGKSASVYKYRLTASNDDFELKSEAWVMLPRAGGEISGWLEAEVPRMINKAEAWTNAVMNAYPPDRPLEEAKGFVLTKAWMYIASNEFDYQGVAGDPTPRYSYTDEDRKGVGPDVIGGRYGNGDFDEPSYATLKGIVVYRAKINNMMYCVWGRTIGYSTFALQLGAHWNSWRRNQGLDNTTSQLSIQIGGALYDACIKKQSLGHLITKEKAKLLRGNGELDDVNLWPNNKIAPMGFSFPEMPTDYNTLSQGDQSGET